MIPDIRNDENLAVAQTHLAMIRFHNRVVDALARHAGRQALRARAPHVVKHYQWMLRTDYLPRICDPAVVDDVFTNGRKVFEVGAEATDADDADRVLGRGVPARALHDPARYDWNIGSTTAGTLDFLFSSRAPAGSSARARGCRATGSPTGGGCTSPIGRPR